MPPKQLNLFFPLSLSLCACVLFVSLDFKNQAWFYLQGDVKIKKRESVF